LAELQYARRCVRPFLKECVKRKRLSLRFFA